MRHLLLILLLVPAVAWGMPTAAVKYERTLIRVARYEWGMEAPVATMAAQVQQESGWNPNAHSAYADGLAEFTPDTATWISGAYPHLGEAQPYNPEWALEALATYDHDLWDKTSGATPCDHMAFVLSAYNGGLGWVYRDQALAKSFHVDPSKWWMGVEYFTHRSAAANKENRGYPRRILLTLQPEYLSWGPGVDCSAVH